jgi:hypothetical protein
MHGKEPDGTVCTCGAELDVTQVSPVLRPLNDVALQDDSIDRMYWYHTSRLEFWPDAGYTYPRHAGRVSSKSQLSANWPNTGQLVRDLAISGETLPSPPPPPSSHLVVNHVGSQSSWRTLTL